MSMEMTQVTATPEEVTMTGDFKKASRSNTLQNLGCVYVAPNSLGGLSFRKNESGPVLHFDADEVHAFFDGVREGEFGEFSPTTV
jgi:hypothetical protein